MQDIRDCLRIIIEESGFKQMAIAKKADISEAKLSAILNKRRRLDANELINICIAINRTPEEVFSRVHGNIS